MIIMFFFPSIISSVICLVLLEKVNNTFSYTEIQQLKRLSRRSGSKIEAITFLLKYYWNPLTFKEPKYQLFNFGNGLINNKSEKNIAHRNVFKKEPTFDTIKTLKSTINLARIHYSLSQCEPFQGYTLIIYFYKKQY